MFSISLAQLRFVILVNCIWFFTHNFRKDLYYQRIKVEIVISFTSIRIPYCFPPILGWNYVLNFTLYVYKTINCWFDSRLNTLKTYRTPYVYYPRMKIKYVCPVIAVSWKDINKCILPHFWHWMISSKLTSMSLREQMEN